jgi:hypothetical protein
MCEVLKLTFILIKLENHVTKISRTQLQQICVNTKLIRNREILDDIWFYFLLTEHKWEILNSILIKIINIVKKIKMAQILKMAAFIFEVAILSNFDWNVWKVPHQRFWQSWRKSQLFHRKENGFSSAFHTILQNFSQKKVEIFLFYRKLPNKKYLLLLKTWFLWNVFRKNWKTPLFWPLALALEFLIEKPRKIFEKMAIALT